LLSKIGIRNASRQILALAAVAALLVVAFWPAAPGPPQQATGPNAINLDAVVGYIPGGDQSHLDGAAFEIPDGDGIAIFFKVNAPSGMDVRVADKVIASPKPSSDWRDFGLLVMPRAVTNQGTPVFVLDNLGYAPANGPVDPATARGWAVARMWMTRVTPGSTLPAQLAADAKVLENIAVLAAQDPKDLYKLVAGLRVLTMSVMKVAGRPAVLIQAGEVSRGDQVTGPLRSARAALE